MLQICWLLLCEVLGCEVWMKYENYLLVGVFKLCGGLVYFYYLVYQGEWLVVVISVICGNYGQLVVFLVSCYGIQLIIVVLYGNSCEKNVVMCSFGVELIEYGEDFQVFCEYVVECVWCEGLYLILVFYFWLVVGVVSYSLELFVVLVDFDEVYVLIGMGLGICGLIVVCDVLGLKICIVGVVFVYVLVYVLLFEVGMVISYLVDICLVDGMVCSMLDLSVLEMILVGVDCLVWVSDREIGVVMCLCFISIYNVVEGVGVVVLVVVWQECECLKGLKVGLIFSGVNVDCEVFVE